MNYIPKIAPPNELINYIQTQIKASITPRYLDIDSDVKQAIKDYLHKEQGGVCCYCQQKISTDRDSSIEHFLPRTAYSDLELKYFNLHLACTYSRGEKNTYCNVKKEDFLIVNLLLNERCLEFFRFTPKGEIMPKKSGYKSYKRLLENQDSLDNEGKTILNLIEILNLNIPFLCDKRKKIIDTILSSINNMDNKRLKNLYVKYQDPKNRKEFNGLIMYFIQEKIK